MTEKRRVSTRNRGEPPLKKRALSPLRPPVSAPQPTPPRTEPLKAGLPIRLVDGRPLPTLPEPQDPCLPNTSYQTIAERLAVQAEYKSYLLTCTSGVLAASLQRSRQAWLTGGFFERYWARPSKKRDLTNTPNPARETMTRLGTCSMIIDPHLFEVTLYTVKDIPPPTYPPAPVQPPPLSVPQYNPFPQARPYGAPNYNASYPAQQPTNSPHQTLPPFREGFGSFGPQGLSPLYHPPHTASKPVQTPVPAPVPKPPDLPRMMGGASQEASQSEGSEPQADPVIQMLATRAANDLELKALMKIVASGKATQKQLREFQDHIDELNSILKSRKGPPPAFGFDGSADGAPPPSGLAYPSNPPHRSSKTEIASKQNTSGGPPSMASQTLPPIKVEALPQPYPVAATAPITKPAGSTKTDISGIVFDFGGTGDRFSIPRFSILEYLYGGTQVIISFIVIRRGSTAASGNYKGAMNYYQPVTMRLMSPSPKILEPLARVVATPDEVRSYMNNYFDRLSPAETVYLATRLPRTADVENGEQQETSTESELPLIKPVYSPPSSIMPLAA